GIGAAALHGNKQQGLRTNVLAGFREGAYPVLVATDVAARGLHIDDVTMVVHVDPSDDVKEYVHRSGRTARAGATGSVVTLALPHQIAKTRNVLSGAKVEPTWVDDVDSAEVPALAELGGRTPAGEPAEDPATVKYKGAPRKLNLTRASGADTRKAEERRANEERRSSWEDSEPGEGRDGARAGRGPDRKGGGRGRTAGAASGRGRGRPSDEKSGNTRDRRGRSDGAPGGERRGRSDGAPGGERRGRSEGTGKGQGRGRSGAPTRAPRRRGGR
ncbi:MAG: helicase-related protein, partial [Brachybacterium sp.]